jgi:hypothetical protein
LVSFQVFCSETFKFSVDFYSRGYEGGREAARQLYSQSVKSLKLPPSTKVVIHIFANVGYLANALHRASFIPKPEILNEFVNGFNAIDEMITFVNVGPGKELPDLKINGTPSQESINIRPNENVCSNASVRTNNSRRK